MAADPVVLRRFRSLHEANRRAQAGAGVSEADVLDAMNRRHIGVLEQQVGAGAIVLHLGVSRGGRGRPFCAPDMIAREALGAFRSPYFSMRLPESQRIWCGISWLEQNRGCEECTHIAYAYADRQGWPQPRRLGELLEGAPRGA